MVVVAWVGSGANVVGAIEAATQPTRSRASATIAVTNATVTPTANWSSQGRSRQRTGRRY